MSEPLLSVVVVTDAYDTIRKTVRHLRAQTIADGIELVVVAAGREEALGLDAAELSELHSHRVVRVDDIQSLSWARAPGIRVARAPIVALAESHCFPEPEWAERLLAAHEQGWAAVGPAIYNANPATAVSWINLLIDYGPWLGPTEGGEIDDLPGHNSAYRRELLLEYGWRLEKMLEAETIMHDDAGSNVVWSGVFDWGDWDAAKAEADHIVTIDELHFHRFSSTPLDRKSVV